VVGHEQAGRRPVVIVQNDVGNQVSPTTIVAVITSRQFRAYPFLVSLPGSVLDRSSLVNCAHLRSVDKARLGEAPIAMLDAQTMQQIDEALRVSLGLY
jgi:mRNA interferase MazF